MTKMHRAQLLLKPAQHQALADIAQKEGRSISDLVREIVDRHLTERDQESRRAQEMQALENLARRRRKIQEEHGVYQGDWVEEVRAERDSDLDRVMREEP